MYTSSISIAQYMIDTNYGYKPESGLGLCNTYKQNKIM